MSTTSSELLNRLDFETHNELGPVTRATQRRTLIIYSSCCLLGLLPWLLNADASWQAAGLGLWLPGAGFVAVGGWSILLFPLTLLLFGVSIIAWFWAGMVLAPAFVWLGAAALAGSLSSETILPGAHLVIAFCVVGIGVMVRRNSAQNRQKAMEKAEKRRAYLPTSLAEVNEMASAKPDETTREMSESDLASLRYVLDRSLQPIPEFNGFDIIDQFQPAALRYQLNHMGFALGIAQGAYTPNFHGYLHEAQQNLIEKYLLRKVWGYWVYESCWGHLNFTNFDPARRDNIMLTGWFGMHVGQYMLNSGDRRYAEPGSLSFRLNANTTYSHDIHSIVGSVADNYEHYKNDFCIYPCEPNWMYPICNHYGMTALASHDRLFNSNYVGEILPTWLQKLDTEFTDPSGSIIGLRSQLTGIEFPFPVGEAGYANFANCFAPERARRLWAVGRQDLQRFLTKDNEGELRITLPGKGLDAGNYSFGNTAAYGSFLTAAREFGETEIAEAALRSLEQDCGMTMEGGVRRYMNGSNLANTNAVMGRIMRTGDFRRSFVEGPAEITLKGPVLTDVSYPDVLVARAFSFGEDLELTLYPGRQNGPQPLTIKQLHPGQQYAVTGAKNDSLTADANGCAKIEVELAGRTAVTLTPLSA